MTEFGVAPPDGAPASRRRRWMWITAPVVVASVFAVAWFQPHKLFIDEEVAEPVPSAVTVAPSADDDSPSPEPAPPQDLAMGSFVSLDHGTSGAVRVLDLGDGSRVVRLEGLDTDNGPDLYLYLTTNPADGEEGGFDDDFVNLGRLKGNQGDQNYELGLDVDLSRYTSVVIWCDRFNSAFGAADLV